MVLVNRVTVTAPNLFSLLLEVFIREKEKKLQHCGLLSVYNVYEGGTQIKVWCGIKNEEQLVGLQVRSGGSRAPAERDFPWLRPGLRLLRSPGQVVQAGVVGPVLLPGSGVTVELGSHLCHHFANCVYTAGNLEHYKGK